MIFTVSSVTSCSLMMYFLSWLMMHSSLLTPSLLMCQPLQKSLLCLMPSHTARCAYIMVSQPLLVKAISKNALLTL